MLKLCRTKMTLSPHPHRCAPINKRSLSFISERDVRQKKNTPPLICISLNKKASIVIYLVLQSTPTHVMAGPGYSAVAPKNYSVERLDILSDSAIMQNKLESLA